LKTLRWPEYSHVLMNVDNVKSADGWEDFKLMEATAPGVHWSAFMDVFNCDSVCLLRPKNLTREEWNAVIDELLKQEGKGYDDLFDLADDSRESCVEMCRVSLQQDPDYLADFPDFEAKIKKVGNLTPQMFRDCTDFEVAFEVKR